MGRLIVFGILLLVAVMAVRYFFSSSKEIEEESASTEMVEDPNCHTFVPKSEGISKNVHGKDHYFCSEKCAEEYAQKT